MSAITEIREQLDKLEILLNGYEVDDYNYQKEIERLEAENADLRNQLREALERC